MTENPKQETEILDLELSSYWQMPSRQTRPLSPHWSCLVQESPYLEAIVNEESALAIVTKETKLRRTRTRDHRVGDSRKASASQNMPLAMFQDSGQKRGICVRGKRRGD
jgi:hypothetical protein